MNKYLIIAAALCIASCSSSKNTSSKKPVLADQYTFMLTEVSTDKTYGLSPKNPVMVGGVKTSEGPINEIRFLNALAGPNGEEISYYRAGSCCAMKSENGFMGMAMLDNYRVTWENAKDTVSIYINMYDEGELLAPAGFTIKQ